MKIFLTSLALLLVVINARCQTKMTEGRIVYEVTKADTRSKDIPDSLGPNVITFRFLNNKQRIDMSNIKDSIMYWLYDSNTCEQSSFRRENGINYADTSQNDYISGMYYDPQISNYKYLNETKTICGYKCYKANYKLPHDTTKFYVYYTIEVYAQVPYFIYHKFINLKAIQWNIMNM